MGRFYLRNQSSDVSIGAASHLLLDGDLTSSSPTAVQVNVPASSVSYFTYAFVPSAANSVPSGQEYSYFFISVNVASISSTITTSLAAGKLGPARTSVIAEAGLSGSITGAGIFSGAPTAGYVGDDISAGEYYILSIDTSNSDMMAAGTLSLYTENEYSYVDLPYANLHTRLGFWSNTETKTTTLGGGGTTHTAGGTLAATASISGATSVTRVGSGTIAVTATRESSALKITYTAWSAPDSEQTLAGSTTVTVDGGVAAAATFSGVAAVVRPASGTLASATTRAGTTAVIRPGSGTRTATATITGAASGVIADTSVTVGASATVAGAAAVFKEITGVAAATASTTGTAANTAAASGSRATTATTGAAATTFVAVAGDLTVAATLVGTSDSNVSGELSVVATLGASADVIHPPQIVPPFADGTLVGAWVNELGGTTNLYQSIDEASPGSLSDYVQSPTAPAASDFYRARFNIPNTPTDNTGHIVRIRHGKTATGGQDISCVVYVRQGVDTIVATRSLTTTDMDTTDRTDVFTLSEAEAGAITDYDTLRVEVSPTVTGGGQKREYRVYWMEFEAPWAPNSGAGSRANTATITGDAFVIDIVTGDPTNVTATLSGEAAVFKSVSGTTAVTVASASTELRTAVASSAALSATTTRSGAPLLTKTVSGDAPIVATVQGSALVVRPASGTTTATATPSGGIDTGDMASGNASAVASLAGSVVLTRGVAGTIEASASHAAVTVKTAYASGTVSATTPLVGTPLATRIDSGNASITATVSGSTGGVTAVSGTLPVTAVPSGAGNVIGLDTPFLTAQAIGLAQIDLDWTTITGATGYDIERDGQIIVINHQQTSYSDTDVTTGLTYVYRVRARKAV